MEIMITYILIFAFVILSILAFIIYKIIRHFKDRKYMVKPYIITKTGLIDDKIKPQRPDDRNELSINEQTYLIDKTARLTNAQRITSFMYLEGCPAPLNFGNTGGKVIKGLDDIKVDSGPLKKVIRSKLFDDLFTSDMDKIKEIIMFVMIGINLVATVAIALKTYAPPGTPK